MLMETQDQIRRDRMALPCVTQSDGQVSACTPSAGVHPFLMSARAAW